MKTISSAIALAVLAAGAAHAQTAFETMTTSSTETVGNVTTNVQTQYVSTTTLVPVDAATPAVVANGVKVKLPSGEMVTIADSADAPWNKDAKLAGYDRFTFDSESGAFVAGKGDEKFAGNWDENGNRVVKKAPAPKKKAKKVAVEEPEAPAEETPAVEAPATEAPAEVPAAQ